MATVHPGCRLTSLGVQRRIPAQVRKLAVHRPLTNARPLLLNSVSFIPAAIAAPMVPAPTDASHRRPSLYLLHCRLPRSSDTQHNVSQDQLRTIHDDLKTMEKVAKHAAWFSAIEAEDGEHVLILTADIKYGTKYNLLEMPCDSDSFTLELPGGRPAIVPLGEIATALAAQASLDKDSSDEDEPPHAVQGVMVGAETVAAGMESKEEKKMRKEAEKAAKKARKEEEKAAKMKAKMEGATAEGKMGESGQEDKSDESDDSEDEHEGDEGDVDERRTKAMNEKEEKKKEEKKEKKKAKEEEKKKMKEEEKAKAMKEDKDSSDEEETGDRKKKEEEDSGSEDSDEDEHPVAAAETKVDGKKDKKKKSEEKGTIKAPALMTEKKDELKMEKDDSEESESDGSSSESESSGDEKETMMVGGTAPTTPAVVA